jgi:hypothetical protein
MSPLGQEATSLGIQPTSGFPSEAEVEWFVGQVRFGPLTVIDAFDPELRKLAENGTAG